MLIHMLCLSVSIYLYTCRYKRIQHEYNGTFSCGCVLEEDPGMYMLVTIYNLSSGIWHLTLATAYVLGNKRTPLKES